MNDIEVEQKYGSGAYTLRDISIVRGEGNKVWDSDGNSYIDCIAGHGAALLGHAHPAITSAIREQSERLMICSNSFPNDKRAQLLPELLSKCNAVNGADFDKVFLCNSGAESVEGALKVARSQTGRPGIVAMKQSFHGRTLGALSLTWRKKYREPYQPLLENVNHIPLNDIATAEEAITGETGGVVVEPVQGEGGVILAEQEYLEALRRICDERGAMLIFDEVQTGFGRTGEWFAFQRYHVTPDILSIAKGMGGGFPIGAVVFSSKLNKLAAGTHGSTFGGNPLACAVSLATIGAITERNLVDRANRTGTYSLGILQDELSGEDIVKDIRGAGFMIGLELRKRVTPVLKKLMDKGILALPAGPTILRFLPPLNIPKDDWEYVLEQTVSIIREYARQPSRRS